MSKNMVKESGGRFLIPAQALTCSEALGKMSVVLSLKWGYECFYHVSP